MSIRYRSVLKMLVIALCLHGASAMVSASSGQALLDAIVDRQLQRVAILLDQGVSPETASAGGEHEGKAALMWAAESGQVAVIRLLLQYGAQIDRNNAKGGTALMYAAVSGQNDAIHALAQAGADLDHRVRLGWTPLLLATVKGHVHTVRALAALGADTGTRDAYGWTLLMHAIDRRDREMVETLLDLGLDPADTDAAGTSAITLAKALDSRDLLLLLEGARRER